jgi:hypothetical protein
MCSGRWSMEKLHTGNRQARDQTGDLRFTPASALHAELSERQLRLIQPVLATLQLFPDLSRGRRFVQIAATARLGIIALSSSIKPRGAKYGLGERGEELEVDIPRDIVDDSLNDQLQPGDGLTLNATFQ